MARTLTIHKHLWVLEQPFVISREVLIGVEVIVVRLQDGGHTGRGEGRGVAYHGETSDSMVAQVESVRPALEAGASRIDLLELLPPGGARNALDAAVWDLESNQTGVPVWQRVGLPAMHEVTTAITIGMRSLEAYEKTARELAAWPWIKVKVGHESPVEAVAAVRRGAPHARLIVDANQAWSVAELRRLVPELAHLGVNLLEQPIPGAASEALRAAELAVPICADEPADTTEDLPQLVGRYDFVNIKLDKAGGLTAALDFADQARRNGLRLMVGCMIGSSLAMAPAMVLAQFCEVADLDGPQLIAGDWADGIEYRNGRMSVPRLWGYPSESDLPALP